MACEINRTDPNDPWGFKCGPLQQLVADSSISGAGSQNDSSLIENYVTEHLKAGGALVHVFKLLGIHEQGKLIDLTGNGRAISSGDTSIFTADEVFNAATCSGWKSVERGPAVTQTAFIGYDFGPIKNCNGIPVYGIDTKVSHLITSLKIKQGPEQRNRATRIRIERSNDGGTWYGVDIITVVDDSDEHEYPIKRSAESRYWRIRPITFNGGANDTWHIINLQMFDYQHTRLDNLQDEYGFMESRDRDYAQQSIEMKCYYDLIDARTELNHIGITSDGVYNITISFKEAVRALGRPMVIGDILELPSEAQFNSRLEAVKKYLEVTDVSWSSNGFTPHWVPTLQSIVAEPMVASQETRDIIGDYTTNPDVTGFLDINKTNIQNFTDITHQIFAKADDLVPERGADVSQVGVIPAEIIEEYSRRGIDVSKLNYNERGLYVEDALPKNGEPYTEGDSFPTNPTNGQYHRLTYMNMNDNIPPRLFKWSSAKNRWIFCEADRRQQYNKVKPSIQQILNSNTSKPSDQIAK